MTLDSRRRISRFFYLICTYIEHKVQGVDHISRYCEQRKYSLKGEKMNSKNKYAMLEFLGILILFEHLFCMVQGDVHFYDFVVSTYHYFPCLFDLWMFLDLWNWVWEPPMFHLSCNFFLLFFFNFYFIFLFFIKDQQLIVCLYTLSSFVA